MLRILKLRPLMMFRQEYGGRFELVSEPVVMADNLVLHEAVHLIKGGDNEAYGVEKSCFECPDTRPGH